MWDALRCRACDFANRDTAEVTKAIKCALTKPLPVYHLEVHRLCKSTIKVCMQELVRDEAHEGNFTLMHFMLNTRTADTNVHQEMIDMLCARNRAILDQVLIDVLYNIPPMTDERRLMHELMIDHPYLRKCLDLLVPVKTKRYINKCLRPFRSRTQAFDLLERAIGGPLPSALFEDCWRQVKRFVGVADLRLTAAQTRQLLGKHAPEVSMTTTLPWVTSSLSAKKKYV